MTGNSRIETELSRERAALAQADRDIRDGQQRISLQDARADELRRDGHDATLADALCQLLRDTMSEWRHHRTLIVDRIAYLEKRLEDERRPSGKSASAHGWKNDFDD